MVHSKSERIAHLDGLRGVAISVVVLFHAYARWPELVPFGAKFVNFPLFKFGWLGVELFFLISGFVILMTLEHSKGFTQFVGRRWIRLFPAMLVCSVVVFLTAPLFPERPAGLPQIRDLLPGLTLIDPKIWSQILGGHQGILEGAFWSLFIEVKFYLAFGAAYFIAGRLAAIAAIILLFGLAVLWIHIPGLATSFPRIGEGLTWLGGRHFGWFAAGALSFCFNKKKDWAYLGGAILLVATEATVLRIGRPSIGSTFAVLAVFALFTLALLSSRAQAYLSHSMLLFIGFISYPLYLLHENLLVALLVKEGKWLPWLPHILMPVLPIGAVVALGWVVASYIEGRVRGVLRLLLGISVRSTVNDDARSARII